MTLRTFLILLSCCAAPALPAGAQAATLDPLKPCYVSVSPEEREPVAIVGGGFTPGAHVDVTVDDEIAAAGLVVDGAGSLVTQVDSPHRPRGEREFTVALAERENPANRASAAARVTALAVSIRPRRADPGRRVRFRGRGFTADKGVYGHYLYAGQERGTVWLGRPEAPCGTFDVRRRQIPYRRPRPGPWTLQVDQQPRYSARPESVFVRVDIMVERVFRMPPPGSR